MTTELLENAPPLLHANSAFMSDFDGTLVELAPLPDAVSVSAGLAGWLHQLEAHLNHALAIVTGRRLADVDTHLSSLLLMGAGAHGAEIRPEIGARVVPIVAPLESTLVDSINAALRDLPDVWVENKTFALAAHFRQNPAAGPECQTRIRSVLSGLDGVEVFEGHAVVEVRIKGVSKGAATRSFLGTPVFAGRTPVFVGDDFADEEAFLAVQSAGGHGIKVGPGSTRAQYRLPDVAAVHRWICESLMQLRKDS